MRILGWVFIAAAGCAPDALETVTFAELGPVTINTSLFNGHLHLGVEFPLRPDEPCRILGDDFTATWGAALLSTWPGSYEEHCASNGNQGGCAPLPPSCARPSVSGDGPFEPAVLELGDASRFVRCDFGDAIQVRGLTLADGRTSSRNDRWTLKRGDIMTARWSHPLDLEGAEVSGSITKRGGSTSVFPVIDGDTITFEVPGVDLGPKELTVSIWIDEPESKACGITPTYGSTHYLIEQAVDIE